MRRIPPLLLGGSDLVGSRFAFAAFVLIALAIRLALLPAAAHPDLLSVYDRVRLWFDGSATLADFSLQALPTLVHGAWIWVSGATLPDFSGVAWPAPSENEIFSQASKIWSRHSLQELALLKLPYLMADVGAGLVLARIVPGRRALGVFALWAAHPLVLYAVSLFGKYEPFMLLPLCLGLFFIQRGKLDRGFLLVGVAVAMRIYPVLVVPAMVLAASAERRRRFELAALSATPIATVLLACGLTKAGLPEIASWLGSIAVFVLLWRVYPTVAGRRSERLALIAAGLAALGALPSVWSALTGEMSPVANLSHQLAFLFGGAGRDRGDGGWWFLLAWCGAAVWASSWSRARTSDDPAARSSDILDAGLVASLSFYSLAFFHPQYVVLAVVFVLARMHRLEWGAAAHGLQLLGVLLLLFAFRDENVTTQLLLPLAPGSLASLPTPNEVLPLGLDEVPWPAIGRALLVVAAAWMVLDLARFRRGSLPRAGFPMRPLPWFAAAATWPLAAWAYADLARDVSVREQVGPAVELEQPWNPEHSAEPLRFFPRIKGIEDATAIQVHPGRPARRRIAEVATLEIEREPFVAEVGPIESVTPVEMRRGRAPDGSYVWPIEGFDAKGWRWHELDVATEREEIPAQGATVRFLRDRPASEVLEEIHGEALERARGASFWFWGALLCAVGGLVAALGAGVASARSE